MDRAERTNTDDTGWETIDLTALPGSHDGDVGLPDYVGGWMAHGHPGYTGYAWYQRAVTVPAGRASWDVLGPTLVEDGYELYWNGQRLGVPGIWFPFNIGVSRTQYVYAIAVPLLALLIVRTFRTLDPGVLRAVD